MDSPHDPELARALAEVEQPLPATDKVPWGGLKARLYASWRLHRVVPDRTAIRLAEWRGRLRARDPAARERASRELRAILSGSGREHEAEGLAEARLVEEAVRTETAWRWWMRDTVEWRGAENFDRTHAQGRGAIVLGAHHSCFRVAGGALLRRRKLYVVGGSWLFIPPLPGASGYFMVKTRRWLEIGGGRWIAPGRAYGAYEVARALLRRGEVVMLHFDVPGQTPTRFLGRDAFLAGGAAKLAIETGAPIVPVFADRPGPLPVVEAEAPVAPAAFDGSGELQAHLAGIVERRILSAPEAYDGIFLDLMFKDPAQLPPLPEFSLPESRRLTRPDAA
jgi:lauroyl/myristoyl acyltransferase